VLDEIEADEAKRALGDTVMTLHATVRNFTGRTITGLEIKGAVVDHDGKSVKERTTVVIPTRQAELDPNKTMKSRSCWRVLPTATTAPTLRWKLRALRSSSGKLLTAPIR